MKAKRSAKPHGEPTAQDLDSQQLLKAALDSSFNFIQVFKAVRDSDGQIIDFTWVLTNRRWQQAYGDVIGKSLLQQNPAVVPTGIFQRLIDVTETGVYQTHEHYYPYEQFDGWFQQTLTRLQDGVVLTTEDITERKRTEVALRESEEKYRTLFESMEQGMAINELVRDEQGRVVDARYIYLNPAYEQQTGFDRSNALGRLASEVFPDYYTAWLAVVERVLTSRQPERFDHYVADNDRWFAFHVTPFGSTDGFSVFYEDITGRKQHERQQEFLLQLSDALRAEPDAEAVGKRVLCMLAEHLHLDRCWISEVFEQQGMSMIDLEYVRPELAPMSGVFRLSDYPETMRQLMTEPMFIQDVAIDPRFSESEKELLTGLHLQALLVVPIRKGQRQVIWALATAMATPRHWTEGERHLLEDVAERTWAAIERARAEADLAKSEEKFRALFHSIDEGVSTLEAIFDEGGKAVDYRYLENNPAVKTIFGFEWPVGKTVREFLPNVEQHWIDTIGGVARTGEPVRTEYPVESLGRWISAHFSRVGGDGSRQVVAVYEDITERRERERQQAFLFQLSDALRAEHSVDEMAIRALGLLGEELRLDRCYIATYHLDDDRADFLYQVGNDRVPPLPKGGIRLSDFPLTLRVTIEGTLVIEDFARTEGLSDTDRQHMAALGLRALVAVTLRKGKHNPHWAIVAVSADPRRWTPGKVALLEEATERTWVAIERTRAEEALRRSEQRTRLAIEAADMGTWEWNIQTNEVYWNEQHFRLFGLEPMPLPIGPDVFFAHIHPDDRDHVTTLLHKALVERTVYDTEFCARLEDGSTRWMSGYGRVVEEAAGKPVRMSGVMYDITERRGHQEALRRSEERQRYILESAHDYAIFTLDLNRRVNTWSIGSQAVLGYPEADIIGQPGDILFTPEDRQQGAPQHEAEQAMQQGRAENERWHVRQDGSRIYGSGVTAPLRDERGQTIGLLKVMRDLTDQQQAQEALRVADQRKDEFLAMLAHELRNPMSTIRSGLQILTLTAPDEMTQSTVTMMRRQTDHLVRMVDDLLDVGRISQNKIELKKQRVNLVELVHQAVESSQPLFAQSGKTLSIDVPTSPIDVEGDATRLMQVVTNLLTNGVRYTGEQGQVWLRLAQQGGEAVLQVRDNGIGLAGDQLKAIFELFVQVDNSTARSKGGLGLGLTLAKRLVELHGGRVDAQSEGLGRGSTFTVHLPTLTAVAQPSALAPPVTDTLAARRILVVDDNADATFTLAMLLKLKGYEAHTRHSGRAGLKAAQQLQPAAILLDIGMPELYGYETCRLLRQQPWGRDLVVIALTGYGQEADRRRTEEAGFNGHLVKPVDLAALTNLLATLLDKDQPTR